MTNRIQARQSGAPRLMRKAKMTDSIKEKLKALGFPPQEGSLRPISKGGSMRSFCRFKSGGKAYIFCEYSAEKRENFLYANIARFLASCGVKVCEIFLDNPQTRTLVISDLGETDLLDFSKLAPPCALQKARENALLEAFKIHVKAGEKFERAPIELMPSFDEKLYAWEQDYFYDNFMRGHLKLEIPPPEREWKDLRSGFLKLPQCLVHRDFQSQNIIVNPQTLETSLIDFQGLRKGVNFYDVGSLIFDPYCDMQGSSREKLFEFYCSLSQINPQSERKNFLKISAQRLMQALGAYAFLADKKGKPEYLKYMRPALENLIFCADCCGLRETLKLANSALNKLQSLA